MNAPLNAPRRAAPALLPVIDVRHGIAVRAVGGDRQHYAPLDCPASPSGDLAPLALWLRTTCGATTCYVADLDALVENRPQWDAYQILHDHGLRLWLDAGPRSISDVPALMSLGLARLIVALESWPDPQSLAPLPRACNAGRCTFSLDLRAGQPIRGSAAWPEAPLEIAEAVVRQGVDSLLVLDLAQVGKNQGYGTVDPFGTLTLCRTLRERYPHIEIATGGGVRDLDDVQQLGAAGVDVVLVGTALHSGAIPPGAIAEHVPLPSH